MYACINIYIYIYIHIYIYIYIGFYNVAMKCVKQKPGAAELQILVSRHEQTPISASLAFAALYLVSFHLHRFTCSMFSRASFHLFHPLFHPIFPSNHFTCSLSLVSLDKQFT